MNKVIKGLIGIGIFCALFAAILTGCAKKDTSQHGGGKGYQDEKDIYKLAEEELSGFLEGNKELDDCCKILQNRAQLYIDEHKEFSFTGEESEDEIMEAATLLYQGHASMRITTAEGKTIYVDPFMGDGYDLPADLILITHGHYDHTQTDLIKTKNPDCVTITQTEALEGGTHQTFDLGYVKVEAVEAGYNKNHDVKNCVGYILTFSNGVTLYLSGDTSRTKDMENFAERNLDYAFFCCDGVYNMDMSEAIECAKLVGAKHSIPYHMVPANGNDGFDRDVAESFDVENRIILAPGDELNLE